MQANQEKMERLQKQYANDKEMYNKKVMEMYKENGISMFSSCLPMILSMVVFFAAIGGFNAYSSYANIHNYNAFVQAYNAKIESYAPEANENTVSYVADGNYFEINSDSNTVYYTVAAKEDVSAWTKEQQVAYVQSVLAYNEKNEKGELIFPIYKAKIDASMSAYEIVPAEGESEKDAVLKYYISQAQAAVI